LLRAKSDELSPRLVSLLVVTKCVLTSLVLLLPQATSECLSGLDVQGRSFPQQIRPLPERAKIKLMTLLPRCPVTHKLLRPLDFNHLNPRLARGSRLLALLEKLLRPEQRMRDGEVLRRYCVPSILLVHELLMDCS
jgi:hypothetical protein